MGANFFMGGNNQSKLIRKEYVENLDISAFLRVFPFKINAPRYLGEVEVAGSNPVIPTIHKP